MEFKEYAKDVKLDYHVVSSYDTTLLENEVLECLEAGYVLYGQPFVTDGKRMHQVVVKNEVKAL